MKRFGITLFVGVLWLSLSAFAQYTSGQQSSNTQMDTQTTTKTSTSADTGKLHHLKGKISDDGKTFTSEKDNKTWTIENPDAVKGHEGHDVSLSAHLNPDKDELHVTSVKMAGGKHAKDKDKDKGGAMSEQPPQ
jgi:hypothetical protein